MSGDRRELPLVETKLHVPSARRNLVARPRLLHALAGATEARSPRSARRCPDGVRTCASSWSTRRRIERDGRTSDPGVWAAGNVVDPRASVIAAAGAAAAAMSINADLVQEDVQRSSTEQKERSR